MDHGRKLIKAVRLLKDGQSTKIQMTDPDAQGLFIGTAALGKPSLDGVCLVVDFKFFDETIPVSIDLFAGAAAKQLRRQATKATHPSTSERKGKKVNPLACPLFSRTLWIRYALPSTALAKDERSSSLSLTIGRAKIS
jgi:hypothetical protein